MTDPRDTDFRTDASTGPLDEEQSGLPEDMGLPDDPEDGDDDNEDDGEAIESIAEDTSDGALLSSDDDSEIGGEGGHD